MIECLIDGCVNKHDENLLMCKPHWFKVSKDTRDEVWSAYRNSGVLSKRYRNARAKAIKEASA